MNTPDSEAGRRTELVMAEVTKQMPKIDTYTYNKVYDGVYEAMKEFFPEEKIELSPKRSKLMDSLWGPNSSWQNV